MPLQRIAVADCEQRTNRWQMLSASRSCCRLDFILAMRKRGHEEPLVRRMVYENPLKFFSQSRNFQFTPPVQLSNDWKERIAGMYEIVAK